MKKKGLDLIERIKNDIFSLVETHGTPLYIYDFDGIRANVLALKNAFKSRKMLLCYALKANPNLSLLSMLAKMECGADCVSINEVKRAILAGIPAYKVIYSGVGKSDSDIAEALRLKILFVNIESIEELLRVEAIARNLACEARISIRVNPNVDAKTHPYISTGLQENKFGVCIEDAKKMYIYAQNSAHLAPVGVHFHIGSQLTDLSPILESARIVAQLISGLLALKIDLKFIDVGGGLGISYNGEPTINIGEYARGISKAFGAFDMSIICEAGRFIVGNEGVLATKILYEKCNENKRFCIVDAAMNDLIRPSLYSATHEIAYIARDCVKDSARDSMDSTDSTKDSTNATDSAQSTRDSTKDSIDSAKIPRDSGDSTIPQKSREMPEIFKDSAPFRECADIVGPICESGDYLAKNVKLPRTKHGDIILIKSAGAYGMSMASNYNSRARAAEVAKIGESYKLIAKRESFKDLVKNEIMEENDGFESVAR